MGSNAPAESLAQYRAEIEAAKAKAEAIHRANVAAVRQAKAK